MNDGQLADDRGVSKDTPTLEPPMNISMHAQGLPLTNRLRDFVHVRLKLALGPLADRIRTVHVGLSDVNGPKGGEDVRCKIQATLSPYGRVLIQEQSPNPFTAVAQASRRAGHSLARRLDRLRTHRRRER